MSEPSDRTFWNSSQHCILGVVKIVAPSAAGQLQATSGSAQKFVWGCMVDFQKSSCNFSAPRRPTVIRQDVVELGATDLKRGFDSGRPGESKVMYCSFEQN